MSAIWGFLDLGQVNHDSEKQNKKAINDAMRESYAGCAIDSYSCKEFRNGFFSCGVQYFNERAHKEILPIRDEETNTIFSADIILNARDSLVAELSDVTGENDGYLETLPDGSLAYLSWKTWKESFIDHIQGLFVIAIFEENSNSFYIFTDHMGHRCINYFIDGTRIFFSTLINPIIMALPDGNISLSEKWITACESSVSPAMYLFPELTPFASIRQVVRGSFIKVSLNEQGDALFCSKESYWNPIENKATSPVADRPRIEQDAYYREKFRKVFKECVKDAIETDGEVAATISSGLDSTSVSAIAATLLKAENKKLYGYTSVTLPDYVSDIGKETIVDESPYVKRFCERYNNIIPTFVSYKDKSALTELNRLVKMLEAPSKSLTNFVWVDEITRLAAENGCKVLLIGQYGNSTISSGKILGRVCQELAEGHLSEAKRQLAAYGRRYGVTRRNLFKGFCSQLWTKVLFDLNLNANYKNSFDTKYLKKSLLSKYRIVSCSRNQNKMNGYTQLVTRKQEMRFIVDEVVAQNVNNYDTRLSLQYGVITRDPTRDKRIVELILSLPPDQFVDDGIERRLVRKYLDDYVPDDIRMEAFRRGRQAADIVWRLKKKGEYKVSQDSTSPLFQYLNYDNVQNLFCGEMTEDNVYDILRIMSLECFLHIYMKVIK